MAVFWRASILQPVILTLICMFGSTMCDDVEYTSVGSDGAICPSATPVSSARSDIECAVTCTANPNCKSFGHTAPFVEGSCLVTEMDNCTLVRGGKTFRKMITSSDCFSASGSTAMILQRYVGDVNFSRPWTDYDNGFGNCSGDFWSGLRNIKNFLGSSSVTLRVEMKDWNGAFLFAEFNGFTVGDSSTNYTMNYAAAGDKNATITLTLLDGNLAFSTMDRDNDKHPGTACSQSSHGNGGFWMKDCGYIYPTAVFPPHMNVQHGYMGYFNGGNVIALKETRIYLKR